MREEASGTSLLTPELMARVRKIQIRTHGLVSGVLQGAYRSNFRGTGIEFEEVRPYLPGDEVRSIDWNVTARTGEPHIKTYVEERQLVLQLLVDTSRSMDFGSRDRTKREVAAELCALLSYVALSQDDQVGLGLFAAGPGTHLDPDKGHRQVLRVIREVVAAPPADGRSSLAAVLDHQLRHLKRRSLVFVISDFLGLDEEPWERALLRVARRHDVLCLRVFDPLEEELPKSGWIELEEIETGARLELDTRSQAVRGEWARRARERLESLRRGTRRARADLESISTVENVADPLIRCFRRRARRAGVAH